jgi:small acid-soluble spore protein (thioredoxin-like protein)
MFGLKNSNIPKNYLCDRGTFITYYFCTSKHFRGGNKMAYNNKPKPDDRSDNVEKLQSMIQHTIQNMEEAEESLEFANDDTQRAQIEAKNERRRDSIDAMRSEVKDEANAQGNQYE